MQILKFYLTYLNLPLRIPSVILSRTRAICLMLLALAAAGAHGGLPFSSATVTRIENHVTLGNHAGGNERPALLHDVIQAQTYIFTKDESRAELEFPDHSIVRVGQNTVFSFDAASRTLSLEKGAMLFYVPPGSGEGNIKTPSLTAAITGTVAKVSRDLIAVLSGQIKTPWGIVGPGDAIEFVNGKVRIFQFDPGQAAAGKLIAWGGPLPELPEVGGENNHVYSMPDLRKLDIIGFGQVNSRFNSHPQFVRPTPSKGGSKSGTPAQSSNSNSTPVDTATPTPNPNPSAHPPP